MKRSSFLPALVAVLLALSNESPRAAFEWMFWLEGSWIRETKRGDVTETWKRVSDTTMEGTATVAAGDSSRVLEHLLLVRFGEEVFYIAKPLENPIPTSFRMVETGGDEAVFENEDHDFPQRIVYMRHGDDSLTVRIEGIADGEERAMRFGFRRRVD